jgi:hypothetical protein
MKEGLKTQIKPKRIGAKHERGQIEKTHKAGTSHTAYALVIELFAFWSDCEIGTSCFGFTLYICNGAPYGPVATWTTIEMESKEPIRRLVHQSNSTSGPAKQSTRRFACKYGKLPAIFIQFHCSQLLAFIPLSTLRFQS